MTIFEAKLKINDVDYTITRDENNQLSIPEPLECCLSSDELIQLLTIIKTLIHWMDTPGKKQITLNRTD